jgi:hypothetical protein
MDHFWRSISDISSQEAVYHHIWWRVSLNSSKLSTVSLHIIFRLLLYSWSWLSISFFSFLFCYFLFWCLFDVSLRYLSSTVNFLTIILNVGVCWARFVRIRFRLISNNYQFVRNVRFPVFLLLVTATDVGTVFLEVNVILNCVGVALPRKCSYFRLWCCPAAGYPNCSCLVSTGFSATYGGETWDTGGHEIAYSLSPYLTPEKI